MLHDTENCAVSSLVTAGECLTALSRLIAASTGAAGNVDAKLYHGKMLHQTIKSGARIWGATLIDAGRKEGAVDIALKSTVSDTIVDAMLDPATGLKPVVVIVSGDSDFASDLRRLSRCGFDTVCVYNDAIANPDYAALASVSFPWRAVTEAALCLRKAAGAASPHVIRSMLRNGPAVGCSPTRPPAGSVDARADGAVAPSVPMSRGGLMQPSVANGGGALSTVDSTPAAIKRVACRRFRLRGSCRYAERCRYVHLCPRGDASSCPDSDSCPLAHGLNDPRLPDGACASTPTVSRASPRPATELIATGSASNRRNYDSPSERVASISTPGRHDDSRTSNCIDAPSTAAGLRRDSDSDRHRNREGVSAGSDSDGSISLRDFEEQERCDPEVDLADSEPTPSGILQSNAESDSRGATASRALQMRLLPSQVWSTGKISGARARGNGSKTGVPQAAPYDADLDALLLGDLGTYETSTHANKGALHLPPLKLSTRLSSVTNACL